MLLPNGWSLKPAGRQTKLGDLPVQIAVHPSQPILAILHAGYGEHEIVTVDGSNGKIIGRVSLPASFAGLIWSADGKRLFAGGGFDDRIYRFDHAEGLLSKKTVFEYPDREGVPGAGEPRVWRKGQERSARSGGPGDLARMARHCMSPRHSAIPWAGLTPNPAHFKASSRSRPRAIPTVWPSTSRASSFMSASGARPRWLSSTPTHSSSRPSWTTEEHPNEMLLAKGGKILFVANANRNTVSVIDTEVGRSIETIGTAIDPKAPPGSTPNSLALSPDESMLFVANANTNNLAVVNVKDPGGSAPLGFIPVGWYPTSVRLARDGKTIYVTNGKGGSSRANRDGPRPGFAGRPGPTQEYIGGLFQGTLSTIPMPTPRR